MKSFANPLAWLFGGGGGSGHKQQKRRPSSGGRDQQRRPAPGAQRSCPGSLKRVKSAGAQESSYEAMRTIDMYLIRQIARSCMDFEMEQKIELEIRLRELAAQSMLEAQDEIDVLEVEKSLLTSDQRMSYYAGQLEQQRKQLSNTSLSTDSGRGSNMRLVPPSLNQRYRTDVVGAPAISCGTDSNYHSANNSTGSPSYGPSSSSQSPSKLSPSSGQSTSSPVQSVDNVTGGAGSRRQPAIGSGHHSRAGAYRYSTNTLSAKRRARNKRRELLMQRITGASNINCNMVVDSRASVSISEIRIPLMWRDVDHFKGRGDYKRFAIFCLLKLDSQIYDTQLISEVDRNVTDVVFDDVIAFRDVDHNFELTLEVYSCVYLEQFSLSSTPRKLKEKLSNSVGKAMGRRLATQMVSSNFAKELQAYDKSYRFAMIASASLRLDDASNSVKTYDLTLVTPSAHHRQHHSNGDGYSTGILSSSLYRDPSVFGMNTNNTKDTQRNTLPLFGHFCCKLSVRPDVFEKSYKTGYLRIASLGIPASNNNNLEDYSTLLTTSSSSSQSKRGVYSTLESSSDEPYRCRTALAAPNKMATLSLSASVVHWGLLRNFALHLWPVDEHALRHTILSGQPPARLDSLRKPPLTLNLDKFARLLRVSNSSLTIETAQGCFVLGAYCPEGGVMSQAEEMAHWLRSIEQPIYDSHIWGSILGHHFPAQKMSAMMSSAARSNQSEYQPDRAYAGHGYRAQIVGNVCPSNHIDH